MSTIHSPIGRFAVAFALESHASESFSRDPTAWRQSFADDLRDRLKQIDDDANTFVLGDDEPLDHFADDALAYLDGLIARSNPQQAERRLRRLRRLTGERASFSVQARLALGAPGDAHFVVFVAGTDRRYGGAEEGGWWYDVTEYGSERHHAIGVGGLRSVLAYLDGEHPAPRHSRSSVLGGTDPSFRVQCVGEDAPQNSPKRRPRYE